MRKKKRNILTKDNKQNNKKAIFISLLIIIFITSIICLSIAYKTTYSKNKYLEYSYNINRNVDYKVNLYENDFIENEYLVKGETYVSDLVKNIESNLSYDFTCSKKIDLKYTYNITATIIGDYQSSSGPESSKIFEKDYIIEDEKTFFKANSSNFKIDENINLDFPQYNTIISEFKKDLKISLNAYVKLTMDVKVTTIDENGLEKLLDTSSIIMNVPLNKQAFNITTDYKSNEAIDVFKATSNEEDNIFLYVSFILLLLDIILLIFNFKNLKSNSKLKSKYKSDLKKILKNYGNIVVEIVNPVKTKLSGVIDVKNFNEMIDLEEELRTPILFYEIPGRNEGWFTIIHQEILYRYVLKENNDTNNTN